MWHWLLVDMVRAKVFLSEMVGGDGMNLCGEHRHLRVVQHDPLSRTWRAKQVDKDDMLLERKQKWFEIPIFTLTQNSVVDPRRFNMNSDPTFFSNAAMNQTCTGNKFSWEYFIHTKI